VASDVHHRRLHSVCRGVLEVVSVQARRDFPRGCVQPRMNDARRGILVIDLAFAKIKEKYECNEPKECTASGSHLEINAMGSDVGAARRLF